MTVIGSISGPILLTYLRSDSNFFLPTRFYEEHLDALNKRKRFSFRKLLEESPQIVLTSTWKEVRKMIKEDPRFTKFSSSDRVSAVVNATCFSDLIFRKSTYVATLNIS